MTTPTGNELDPQILALAALASDDGADLLLSLKNKLEEETGLSTEESFIVGFTLARFMVQTIADQLRNSNEPE